MLVSTPKKEVRSWTTDSRRWANYKPREGDIVIATAPKCGTTWTQQIASLLVFQSPEARDIQNTSPWIDFRLPPVDTVMAFLEAQSHRRFIKSHLPFDAMPIYDEVQYIHVARDGRDAFMSWHNHTSNYSPLARENQSAAGMADETVARPLPSPHASPHDHFQVWIDEAPDVRLRDDSPASNFFALERSWWAERKRPNILLVHYNDMKADLGGEMRRIADFLDIEISEDIWEGLIAAASFEFMRDNGATLLPRAATSWDKGHERFINKGTNERWRTALTPEDAARYAERSAQELSPSLSRWLEQGRLKVGDPKDVVD